MDIKDIEKLASLAKIELTDKEKDNLLKDLDGVLNYVKQIESVEVQEIEPEYQNKNVWREDEIKSSVFSRDLIMNQFPDSQDDFVKVKKIL
jgi:aspartyl-tRNA(Asn)/glutamyl-tRNA(Gln) amidotransferase subunit C